MISKRREHQSCQDIGLIRNSCVLIGEGKVIVTGDVWSLFASNVCKGIKITCLIYRQKNIDKKKKTVMV